MFKKKTFYIGDYADADAMKSAVSEFFNSFETTPNFSVTTVSGNRISIGAVVSDSHKVGTYIEWYKLNTIGMIGYNDGSNNYSELMTIYNANYMTLLMDIDTMLVAFHETENIGHYIHAFSPVGDRKCGFCSNLCVHDFVKHTISNKRVFDDYICMTPYVHHDNTSSDRVSSTAYQIMYGMSRPSTETILSLGGHEYALCANDIAIKIS